MRFLTAALVTLFALGTMQVNAAMPEQGENAKGDSMETSGMNNQHMEMEKGEEQTAPAPDMENQEQAQEDKAVTADDQQLLHKIREQLGSSMSVQDADKVNIEVDNGKVTLFGSVKSTDDKMKIANDIQNIKGVNSVTNEITVQEQQ